MNSTTQTSTDVGENASVALTVGGSPLCLPTGVGTGDGLFRMSHPVPRVFDSNSLATRSPVRVIAERRVESQERQYLIQEREGSIISLEKDTFTAIVRDPRGNEPEEFIEFPRNDIPTYDRDLLRVGASFYWGIFYADNRTRTRSSQIRLRRLPKWSEAEMKAAVNYADRLQQQLSGAPAAQT